MSLKIFFIIFEVHKEAKILNKSLLTTKNWSQKLPQKIMYWPKYKKAFFKIRLSLRGSKKPLNIFFNFYFNPKGYRFSRLLPGCS
jgi:hypothetical protein